jgi:predicted ABC-class ATPase
MTRDPRALVAVLDRIDKRGYKAYKDLQGRWSFQDFDLSIDHVQGDPFADASRVHVVLAPAVASLPPEVLRSRARRLGVASLLARTFGELARRRSKSRGSGKSGEIRIESPLQEVLDQTAVLVGEDGTVEARFRVGLPAAGRRVLAGEARELLTEDVPAVAGGSLRASEYEGAELLSHATVNEDSEHLRGQLADRRLVSFVGDGSSLPRRSGIDDRPLEGAGAVPFRSPDRLRVTLERPNAGPIEGMGIPVGVTLIVGGGYHGKSTLLRAVERGVYNHRPGDGRECVVTDRAAVKVRAEDGRAVSGVDISPFIDNLPQGRDTHAFSTPNASGSTSQAAAIIEAREAGATVLLVDEDTAATNFMIRDRRMQALVPKECEPITPFVDRARQLHADAGMSSVLVLGGSGDYLDIADTVIAMRDYRPVNVTDRARSVADWTCGRSS